MLLGKETTMTHLLPVLLLLASVPTSDCSSDHCDTTFRAVAPAVRDARASAPPDSATSCSLDPTTVLTFTAPVTYDPPGFTTASVTIVCPAGYILLTGGYTYLNAGTCGTCPPVPPGQIRGSMPMGDPPTSWYVIAYEVARTSSTTMTVTASCIASRCP